MRGRWESPKWKHYPPAKYDGYANATASDKNV